MIITAAENYGFVVSIKRSHHKFVVVIIVARPAALKEERLAVRQKLRIGVRERWYWRYDDLRSAPVCGNTKDSVGRPDQDRIVGSPARAVWNRDRTDRKGSPAIDGHLFDSRKRKKCNPLTVRRKKRSHCPFSS